MPSAIASALIVGADGFVGGNLRRVLETRGVRVAAIGRADGDLSDGAVTDRLFAAAPAVDRIFHLVTRQRTGEVQYGIQGELLAVNARIHLNVLEAWRLRQPQAKLISAGSSCAYPAAGETLAEGAFQGGPVHPSVQGYALAKQVLAVGSETYGRQYGLRWLHCIFATLYGPGDHYDAERSHVVGALIDRAIRERAAGAERFTVWGAPGVVREVLHVDDQIDAMLAADAAFENELVNCAANRPVTVHEVAQAVVDALGWPAAIVYPPDTFIGTGKKVLDSSRFLERTGWRPRLDLATGLPPVVAARARELGLAS
jgi:GDP-L-fucose synthase